MVDDEKMLSQQIRWRATKGFKAHSRDKWSLWMLEMEEASQLKNYRKSGRNTE